MGALGSNSLFTACPHFTKPQPDPWKARVIRFEFGEFTLMEWLMTASFWLLDSGRALSPRKQHEWRRRVPASRPQELEREIPH